uniref:Uncharacterized protein n=1 Tax=viral metagenome TaxID=1070528 RepID=A0A6C0H6Q4_9ZZZZ
MDAMSQLTKNICDSLKNSESVYKQIDVIDKIHDINILASFEIDENSLTFQIEHKHIVANGQLINIGFNGNIVMFEKEIIFIKENELFQEIKNAILSLNETLSKLVFNKISGHFYEDISESKQWDDVIYLTDIFGTNSSKSSVLCVCCNEITLTKTINDNPLCLLCWKSDNLKKMKMIKLEDLKYIKYYPFKYNAPYNYEYEDEYEDEEEDDDDDEDEDQDEYDEDI